MRNSLIVVLAAAALAGAVATAPAVNENRGGLMGFIAGCCFGMRAGAAYNDGKDVVAMEWVDALLIGHIWSFIQGWQGTTTADLREQYGASFF